MREPQLVDDLIRRLVQGGTLASSTDVQRILVHIASAPFSTRPVAVPRDLVGRSHGGYVFGAKAPSSLAHLGKRVLLELQWAEGTTFDQYLADLRSSVADPSAHLVVFQARGLTYAGVLGPNALPAEHLGVRPEAYIWVLYDSDHGTITTGYQVSSETTLTLPENARWLTQGP